jgi:uncharacterized membrane protein HdeD (DUF308 family)
MKEFTMNTTYGNLFILKPKNQVNKVNSEIFNEQIKSVKYWNFNLILGITFILVSLLVFTRSETTYTSLAMVFSVTLLFTGILEIFSSIQNRNLLNEWGLSFIVGIIDLLVSISIIIISQPQISSEALTLIMGYVFLYRSIKLITWSTVLKNYEARNWGWLLFGSIAGVLLSFLLIWNRTFPSLTHIFFTSFAFLLIGISEIYFSFVLRKINRAGIVSSN